MEASHPQLSLRRQCEILGLNRSTFYYRPAQESDLNLHLMRLIDEQYMKTPFYGWPRMTAHLRRQGYAINHKRIQRLMIKMGLQAIYPKRRTSVADKDHKVYPYLLRNLAITHPNQVWSADITYIPMLRGFMYLVAVIDWYSRYVLAWRLSNTLDGRFCQDALGVALADAKPDIFNTDKGAHGIPCRVHSPVLHVTTGSRWDPHQYGWPRAGPGQRVRRKALAHSQVREHLPARIWISTRAGTWLGAILRVLQSGASAPESIVSASCGGAFCTLHPPGFDLRVSFLLAISWSRQWGQP